LLHFQLSPIRLFTELLNFDRWRVIGAASAADGPFLGCGGWGTGDVVVVSHLLQTGQEGYHRVKDGGKIHVRGLGLAATVGTKMRGQQATFYENRLNGSSVKDC
jgi:hypothetical protein